MADTMSARELIAPAVAVLPPLDGRVTLTPLTLRDDGGRPVEVPTRVEDLRLEVRGRRGAAAEIVIAQPSFAGNLVGESVDRRYLVRWMTERGPHELPARFVARERIGPLLIGWRLRVTGPVTRVQRRAHARVEIAIPVDVLTAEDAGPHLPPTLRLARLLSINISEGGLLAVSPAGASPEGMPPVGAAVRTGFAVAGEAFALAGHVVRHQPSPGGVCVAVAFDSPDAHGDRLRPLLFAHQLRARRVGVR